MAARSTSVASCRSTARCRSRSRCGAAAGWPASGLPPGRILTADGRLRGVPSAAGRHQATITATRDGRPLSRPLEFVVESRNLAPDAAEVLGPATPQALAALRDGVAYGGASVESPKAATRLEVFGYRWAAPQTIGALALTFGRMGEYGGWTTSLSVEHLDDAGTWVATPGVRMTPEPVLQNDKHLRPHYAHYRIDFPAVRTTAIRVKGLNGGEGEQRYVSLSELAVFP